MLFTVGSACSLGCIRSLLGNTRGKSAKQCSSQSAVDAHITSQYGRLASTSPTMPYGTGKQSMPLATGQDGCLYSRAVGSGA